MSNNDRIFYDYPPLPVGHSPETPGMPRPPKPPKTTTKEEA